MGQAFSFSSKAKETPLTTPERTPPRAPNCADPRSPTRDIERTPITVNTPVVGDENSFLNGSATKDEKPRKVSLRQMMFERNKNDKQSSD